MTMELQCRDAIYNYADAECQLNAALTGEHAEYVKIVIQLMRDSYHEQVRTGATNFVVPDEVAIYLTQECPW